METKIAETQGEFNQIHMLNYMTFVEEIPQHEAVPSRVLIDKFHDKNTYIISKYEDEIIGMLAYNAVRPFSLDNKIDFLEKYLPTFNTAIEIRLLSIVKEKRKSFVLYNLLKKLVQQLENSSIDIVLISGTTKELSLYHKIGFIDFAYLVGTEDAQYQPMYLKKENIQLEFIKKWLNP